MSKSKLHTLTLFYKAIAKPYTYENVIAVYPSDGFLMIEQKTEDGRMVLIAKGRDLISSFTLEENPAPTNTAEQGFHLS